MQANLLWVDLEMTGLDPVEDRIIEVGVIATDYDFNEVSRYQVTVQVPDELMKERMVGEFWDKHAATREVLMAKNNSPEAKTAAVVEAELIKFIETNFDMTQPIYLAGNSVHQDRKFIEREWVRLNKLLHYRMLDVSAWKIIFNHYGVKFTKPEAHRAMSDIEGSIEELKYYLKKVSF